jgi:hypothetical protein
MFNQNIVLLFSPARHPASKMFLSVEEPGKVAFIALIQIAKGVRTPGTSFTAVKVPICKEANLNLNAYSLFPLKCIRKIICLRA